jgi:uncharacterized protein VirK/YbjX
MHDNAILDSLITVYREECDQASATLWSPALRCLAAARILLFPKTVAQFNSMKLNHKLSHPARRHDPLYFLAHNYYISRRFTLRQRVGVAMCHHEYELQAYNSNYARQIYRSGGVLLWEKSFDDLHFAIVLTASPDNRHEGDLTVILSVNSVKLCRMSFCYLNANIFSLRPFMTMLISRNQTHRASGRDVFDRCFKQNSPQLFCLSALCGIALANGFQTIFAIKHDAQVAYEEPYDANFRNSYTTLWEKFQAVEIDRHVYMMSVPLTLRPVGLVSRAHRRRARNRRGNWEEIVHSACESIAGYRTGSNWAVSLLPASQSDAAPRGCHLVPEAQLSATGGPTVAITPT